MLLAAPESPVPGWGHPVLAQPWEGTFSLQPTEPKGCSWRSGSRLAALGPCHHQRVQPGSLSPTAPQWPHNGPTMAPAPAPGVQEPGGWESTARGLGECRAGRQRCRSFPGCLWSSRGRGLSGDADGARLCALDPHAGLGLGPGCWGASQVSPVADVSVSPSPKVVPRQFPPQVKVGDGTIFPRFLAEWTGIFCAAQPTPLIPTRALWPKMFPSPFLRLDSIPPTLPPPSGNVAAINSLNASADAGAGCAKTPFLGPGLSWVSAVLGCAGASGTVGNAGNVQGLLST